MNDDYERVHTVTDYYDGPIAGVADFRGAPHLFAAVWDDQEEEYGPVFRLTPLASNTFNLLMEDWQIWRRWEHAFQTGVTTVETHPALPGERARHDELRRQIDAQLKSPVGPEVRIRGEFVPDPGSPPLGILIVGVVVKWTPL
jgi:hypothetical protein